MSDQPKEPELADLRQDYGRDALDQNQLDPDPIAQFKRWFNEASEASIEPNAMTLATCTPDGLPSARILLLKGLDDRGFVFYSNYDSRKGQELEANPQAALVFYWSQLERQVRVTGTVVRTSREETETYFQTRPRGSQLSACISNQSQQVTREELESEWAALEAAHPNDSPIPTPANWGGYRLQPDEIEFWQGRPSRLHDRLVYRKLPEGWTILRLAP